MTGDCHAPFCGGPRVRSPRATRHCQDGKRRGAYPHTDVHFLGLHLSARRSRARTGGNFTRFLPAISKDALQKISRRSVLADARPTGQTFGVARDINPIVRGWMKYYGKILSHRTPPPSAAHQRLPGALDPTEVQTVTGEGESLPVLAGDRPTISSHVCALEMDPFRRVCLMKRMTGAV